ncbi:hypothetical protein E1286_01350 [Nonomuraea terrae]|uniref:DDE Tnp4 domain-containing protein n=1 Tax=Nonomuraea terrae TaxID=2530383 RepID=A0A4R4ZEN6_9ACTN|nr:hypothetical protein E1286_01350 [Nonomuraea terrae]
MPRTSSPGLGRLLRRSRRRRPRGGPLSRGGPGERAHAQLKSWRILRKLRCSPGKAGYLCKAVAVLQNHHAAGGRKALTPP